MHLLFQEAEQQEYEKFVSAINTCKWYFWTSECTVPPPDPLLFMKHMNPLKIAVRMFTSLISEPVIAINSTIKIILHGVTGKVFLALYSKMQAFLKLLFLIIE